MSIVNFRSNFAPTEYGTPGQQNVLDHKVKDIKRVTDFMYTTSQGALFLTKQVGLQFANPKMETNSSGFFNTESARIYNGVNTLSQVVVQGTGAHLDGPGLIPTMEQHSKYEYIVEQNNRLGKNRLVDLYKRLVMPANSTGRTITASNQYNTSANQELVIDSYIGGPNSLYGVGDTVIRRAYNTSKQQDNIHEELFDTEYFYTDSTGLRKSKINYAYQLGLSKLVKEIEGYSDLKEFTGVDIDRPLLEPAHLNQEVTIITRLTAGIPEYRKRPTEIIDDSSKSQYILPNADTHIGATPKLVLDSRINMNSNVDGVNLVNIYNTKDLKGNEESFAIRERDLIKLKFEVIDSVSPNKSDYMVFRSYLKGFSNSVNSNFNEIRYMGRGDVFHTYDSYNENYTISFDIAAMSAAEMPVIYNKLNYLKSCLAPTYSGTKMMGNIFRLTVGNWLNRVPGLIKTLELTIPEDAPWDIDIPGNEGTQDGFKSALELPRYINVSFTFTPIYNHLVRKSRTTPFISVDKLGYLK